MLNIKFKELTSKIDSIKTIKEKGIITRVVGITLEAKGFKGAINETCIVYNIENKEITCEIVGFREDTLLLMAMTDIRGISPGCIVIPTRKMLSVKCGYELLGTVLDGLGNPIDGEEITNYVEYPLNNDPPNPLKRKMIEEIIPTGIKAIDSLITCAKGIRIGIMAGSGVGKSTTLGMIARKAKADINVICLIGERGREVLEFVKKDLGEEGLSKSIIVCATSDQQPLVRIKSAFTATAIAEYFRDLGKDVILMMDSVTRFAMAQREIGLATGEPPAQKGYTPSVFSMLPKLMERAGTSDKGTITAFYTVLVDGDDFNEPIADAVRGILDGHIVLSRNLAINNHYPAIDVLASISRIMNQVVCSEQKSKASEVRELLSTYKEAEDLINIGAYKKGNSPKIDRAINYNEKINNFLKQKIDDETEYEKIMNDFYNLLN